PRSYRPSLVNLFYLAFRHPTLSLDIEGDLPRRYIKDNSAFRTVRLVIGATQVRLNVSDDIVHTVQFVIQFDMFSLGIDCGERPERPAIFKLPIWIIAVSIVTHHARELDRDLTDIMLGKKLKCFLLVSRLSFLVNGMPL